MCSSSSSADRRSPLPAATRDDGDLPPPVDLPGATDFILRHATLLGPCTVWFIKTLWVQASHHAYQQSAELLAHVQRYTPGRIERACELALLYRLEGLPALRFILAEDLDRLPLRPDAALTGQLLLPFPKSRP